MAITTSLTRAGGPVKRTLCVKMKTNFRTIKWAIRVGYLLALYSALAFIVKFLPVDFWVMVSNLFSSEEEHIYYKVVVSEGSESYALITLVLGVSLIVVGKFYAAKENT